MLEEPRDIQMSSNSKEEEALRRKYSVGCAEKRSEDTGSHCLQESQKVLKIEAGLQSAKKMNRARMLFSKTDREKEERGG